MTTHRALAVVLLTLVVLSTAAACPENRVHHGEIRCYNEQGQQIPCDFGSETP